MKAKDAKQVAQAFGSYQSDPPKVWGMRKVVGVQGYEKGRHLDVEGQELPKERMLIFDLEDDFRAAVLTSGTESKMKTYFFEKRSVRAGE